MHIMERSERDPDRLNLNKSRETFKSGNSNKSSNLREEQKNTQNEGAQTQACATVRRGASDEGLFVIPDGSAGSSFFVPSSIASEFSLHADMRITRQLLDTLHEASTLWRVRKKAVDLLSRREHSRQELTNKLQQRSFPEEVVRQVVREMADKDYLNDRRYASLWIRSRIQRHPEGPARLAAGLQERGISRDIISDVLSEEITEEVLNEVLDRAIAKLQKKRAVTREKMLASLSRLGFSYHQIRRRVDELYR
jgi:regulatory protein